jgi:chromosome segregation ATPase
MPDTPIPNKRTTSPEFTPIGSKSGGAIETTTHSFTNMSPINRFSDNNFNIRHNGKINNLDSTRRLNSTNFTNFTLHRTHQNSTNRDNRSNIDILQSSSVASSIWDDNEYIETDKHRNNQTNTDLSNLFKRNGISKGTDVIPDFSNNNIDNNNNNDIEIGSNSNMLKLQSELVKKLQTENTNLRVEVMTLRQHLSGLPMDSAALIEQNVALNKQIITLTERLESNPIIPSINDTANNTVAASEKDVNYHYETEIEDLKDQLYDYKQQLATVHDNYQNVLSEKENLLHENFEKESDIKKLQQECNKYESDIFDMKLQLDEIKSQSQSQSQSQKQSADSNEIKIQNLEDKIDALEDTNYNYQKEVEELSKEINDLEDQNSRLKDELYEQQHILESHTDNEVAEKSQHFDTSEVIEELKTKITDLKIDIRTLENDKKALQKKYDDHLRVNYHSSREKVEEMTKRLEEATNTIDILDKDLEEKRSTEKQLSKNIKQLNLQIDSLQRKNDSLQEKLNKMKGNNSDATELLTHEIDDLYAKIDEYEIEIGELKEIIDELENEKHENSVSDEYINDLEDDKDKLYQTLLETQDLIKSKDEEISNLKYELVNISSNNKTQDDEYVKIDELINLKEKIEEEREKYHTKMNALIVESESKEANLLQKIQESEESKSKLIELYENLQLKFHELEQQYDELLNSKQVEELSSDLAKVSIEYKKSQNENENLINKFTNEIRLLNDQIYLKDLEISNISQKLQTIGSIDTQSLNSKLNILEQTVKDLNSSKDKLEKEKQKIEDENLKLKMTGEKFQKESKINQDLTLKVDKLENEKSLLKLELKEKKYLLDNLQKKIVDLNNDKKELNTFINEISTDQDQLEAKSSKLSEKVMSNDITIKSKLHETESKLENMKNQYNDMVSQYNYMKDDLIERLKEMRKMLKDQGKNNSEELDEWKQKYDKANSKLKVSERYLKVLKNDMRTLNEELEIERNKNQIQQWYPPTPQSPSRDNSSDVNKLQILKDQKELLMLKLKISNEKISDLKYMIKYYNLELMKKNEMFERNKSLFHNIGIQSKRDEKSLSPVSKLRVGIITVLAGIRFKNRLQELKTRSNRENELKNDIKAKKGGINFL